MDKKYTTIIISKDKLASINTSKKAYMTDVNLKHLGNSEYFLQLISFYESHKNK